MGFDRIKALQSRLANATDVPLVTGDEDDERADVAAADTTATVLSQDFPAAPVGLVATDGDKDTTSTISKVVDKLVSGISFVGNQFNRDYKDDREAFSDYLRSPMIKSLLKGLFDYPQVTGLKAALESPMLNLGSVICSAADDLIEQGDEEVARLYSCTTMTMLGECRSSASQPDSYTFTSLTPQFLGAQKVSLPPAHTRWNRRSRWLSAHRAGC